MGVDAARWILDDGPLDVLAQAVEASAIASWPIGELLVAPRTQTDAAKDPSERRVRLLAAQVGGKPVIEVLRVGVGSPAFPILYDHMRSEFDDSQDRAEREAIAWGIAVGSDAILVTCDKRAALTGLAELGRCRVAHPFDLWIHLRDSGRLTGEQFAELCDRTARRDQGLPGIPWRLR